MVIVQFILVAIEVITALLLTIIILMQRAKSEGLGLAFGSGMGEALFGSRAGNILTKLTIILAVIFMANTVLLSLVYSGARGQTLMSRFGMRGGAQQAPMQEQPIRDTQRPASAPAQAGGAPTLPGTDLGDQPVPAPAAEPEPAEESQP